MVGRRTPPRPSVAKRLMAFDVVATVPAAVLSVTSDHPSVPTRVAKCFSTQLNLMSCRPALTSLARQMWRERESAFICRLFSPSLSARMIFLHLDPPPTEAIPETLGATPRSTSDKTASKSAQLGPVGFRKCALDDLCFSITEALLRIMTSQRTQRLKTNRRQCAEVPMPLRPSRNGDGLSKT